MVNNAEQSKSGGDPKSEEPLVDGGDAQRKKLTASNDERNEMDEVMKNMRNDAAARDRSRAVIYIATVRPAMAGARYVRTERKGRDEDCASMRGVSVAAVGKAECPAPRSKPASATEPEELTAVDGDPVIDVPAASRAVYCHKTMPTITNFGSGHLRWRTEQ
ncbi:hypothetical protein PF007_g13167 [Phytophthora fragariae]|uniref:Uncharacterized protein n=1 Tax=Phytophthora fragariae TaxID=53985 RepID=A0A6A3L4T1_9STRA|nr:hypothetical protein PF003_g10357 [Phytophthora fragariae]KAE8940802.1 hypothetical protein PF009_g9391 [Phytophthora fragariae]KAE9012928.1 hypothetical protein PF011_g8699 [Phytophthora fragariae]KAE9107090.1 hypothetical protein PF007_g13167 [Phytophthora fragariae]